MGVITQVSPFFDTVVSPYSATYAGLLQSSGGVGAVTYITTSPNGSVIVDQYGHVTTLGLLQPGPYPISGVLEDGSGNLGAWAFTLNVIATSPQTSVIPVVPLSPNGIEINIPFQIDPATGAVAQTSAQNQIIANHIETVVMTSPLSRVMMPTYGAGIENQVFAGLDSTTTALLTSDITKALAQWEPSAAIKAISTSAAPGQPSTLNVTITFSIANSSDVNVVTMTTGGTITQVNS